MLKGGPSVECATFYSNLGWTLTLMDDSFVLTFPLPFWKLTQKEATIRRTNKTENPFSLQDDEKIDKTLKD